MMGNLWTFWRRTSLLDVNWRDRTSSRSHGDTEGSRGQLSCQAEAKRSPAGRAQSRPRLPAGHGTPGCALATIKPMR